MTMKIIKEDELSMWIELPCKTVIIIDRQDAWLMEEFPTWCITGSRSRYACVERPFKTEYSIVRERVYLHRAIIFGKQLSQKHNLQVDHINRDRLDNRRSNLRICSNHQNMANVGPKLGRKYKGVFDQSKYRKLDKSYSSYIAYIDAKNGGLKKRKYLGYFSTAEEAARAYDKAAKEIYGEFAYQNLPDSNSGI